MPLEPKKNLIFKIDSQEQLWKPGLELYTYRFHLKKKAKTAKVIFYPKSTTKELKVTS